MPETEVVALAPGEFSFDGGKTWISGTTDEIMAAASEFIEASEE
jgi:hypothetical protein